MPAMANDVLIFCSDAFSLEPPRDEPGFQYDLPLGDDIAAYLKEQLEIQKVGWLIDDPVREDYGAVLMLCRGKKVFTVTLSWQGGNEWGIAFGQSRGCLGWLFNRAPDAQAMNEIEILIDAVVMNDPSRFRGPKWKGNGEFPGFASAFIIPK